MITNVLDYLEETVSQHPSSVAIEDEFNSVTFQNLKDNAIKLSGHLIDSGLRPGQPVAVFMPKSVKAIEAFLGILYAGGFYIPLDISNPTSRIDSILKNIEPKFIIAEDKHLHSLSSIYDDSCFVDMERVTDSSFSTNFAALIDTDPAYCINTSGSTGTPKGVLINHRSIIDYIDWAKETYAVSHSEVIGSQAPFYFDNSTLDIYLMLATGAKLVLIPDEKFTYPYKLIEYLNDAEINFIFWVPSVLVNVANLDVFSKLKPNSLSKILFAGEVMPNKHLNYWRKALPSVLFSNLYGPTEITVDCTYYIVDRDFADDDALPIGIACGNSDVFLIDKDDHTVIDGDIGELCVRGSSLALGYYNNPGQTKIAFTSNPLNKFYSEIIYRTGDLAFRNKLGEFIYVGRKDTQIKHMGYRIEMGEIESAIVSTQGVDNACVIYIEDEKKIIVFYVGSIEFRDVRKAMMTRIPRYMIPSKWFQLDELPLSKNGKIDRLALKSSYCG